MIGTIFHVSLIGLLRDRVALALTFVLPLVFFSIFASVFSALDPEGLEAIPTVVVVDGQSRFGLQIAERLAREPQVDVEIVSPEQRGQALEQVRRGRSAVAVLIPPGLLAGSTSLIELHADKANPLGSGVVEGLVQAAAAATTLESLGFDAPASAVPIRVVDALGRSGKRPSIAFFAAGLGVMFLMFAVTGRSAILLEERETGVLSRLLAARVGMTRLLAGRWLFLVAVGSCQVCAMFVWAAMVFKLELFTPHHLAGFLLVTLVTAAAASAFGLILSSACRTRAQLNGIAVVVILTLSAVGGNMFPGFLMPQTLRSVGRLTFNAWALAAYQKIFWYERPLVELWPELLALGTASAVFLAVARLLARRWQRTGGLSA